MNEEGFEGTLVLEKLARINKIEEFIQAVDSDDLKTAKSFMQMADIDSDTIAIVLKKMADLCDEH